MNSTFRSLPLSQFRVALLRNSHQPTTVTIRTMSASTNGAARAPTKPSTPEKKPVKILMIHGFTQNGPLFRAKTRALEKTLTKLLAPVSLTPQLLYPTGPIRLKASDMPFYEPPSDAAEQEPETWAWWRRNDATGQYTDIDRGMTTLADAIREAGGVDGVVGFSQGGCAAGVVAAALESERRPLPDPAAGGVDEDTAAWVAALRAANGGQPLKFCVVYSGFRAADPDVGWLFEPKIATPTLHILGSLDTSVDEARSQTLIQVCEDPLVVTHPGGHHVPVAREWIMPLAGFIKQHVYDKEVKAEL